MSKNGISNRRDSFTELDDGLEGVDDFTNEPNPFDDVIADDFETKSKPPGYGNTDDTVTLPPGYEETVETEQAPIAGPSTTQSANETLPPGLLNHFSQYFQLSDQELKKNLYAAITFKSSPASDLETGQPNPELYGAVWIFATIVATNFIGSQLFKVIANGIIRGVYWQDDANKKYGGSRLIHSFWLYLVYAFAVPLVIAKMSAQHNDNAVSLIATFGYSQIAWIPLGLLLDLTSELQWLMPAVVFALLKWFLVLLAFAKSSLFLHARLSDRRLKFAAVAANAALCVIARFLLYHS